MALQGIDMLCDSKWGQTLGGLASEHAHPSSNLPQSKLPEAVMQQIPEGVEADTRPQPSSEVPRRRK
jgi:hypothetical protein